MPYSFELKLVITGNSLQEIDNALTEAATERLRARALNPASIPTGLTIGPMKAPAAVEAPPPPSPIKTVETHSAEPIQEKRKPGRPSRAEVAAREAATQPVEPEEVAQTGEAFAPAQAVATPAQAIDALKMVNAKHNVNVAMECLAKFGVTKCGQLSDDNRHLFIQHCESICA